MALDLAGEETGDAPAIVFLFQRRLFPAPLLGEDAAGMKVE
jgi:hypothetical protein